MSLRTHTFNRADHFGIIVPFDLAVTAADNVHLGQMFGIVCDFARGLFVRIDIAVRGANPREGAEGTALAADIGVVDMQVAHPVDCVADHSLTGGVGDMREPGEIVGLKQSDSLGNRKPFSGADFLVDGQQGLIANRRIHAGSIERN